MVRLDDCLGPLSEGVWEVVIPKSVLTEPPGPGWERSAINIPSPGTIASYRNGQYHAHETADDYRVHVDRYDPKAHPILHLADDAPLLLMVADTFGTLVRESRDPVTRDTRAVLEAQETTWQRLVLAGASSMVVAFLIISDPLSSFEAVTQMILPLVLGLLGIITLAREIRPVFRGFHALVPGVAILAAALVAALLSLEAFTGIVLAILGVWALLSSLLSFRHLSRGRAGVPEGFGLRLGIALGSLAFAATVFLAPEWIVPLLMETVGILGMVTGFILLGDGLRLRKRPQVSRGGSCR